MAFVETYRSVVSPSDCDILGHMNVSRYFWVCGNGVFSLQTELGLGLSEMTGGRRLSFAVVHAESDFRSEIMPGEVIYLMSAIVAIGGKSIDFRHRLFTAEHDRLAFECSFRSVLMNLDSRRGVPIPDDVRARAAPFLIDGPEA